MSDKKLYKLDDHILFRKCDLYEVVIHSMEIALTLRSNKYIVRIIISVTKKAFTFIVPDIPK